MRIPYRFAAVFALSMLFVSSSSRADEQARWPQGPNELAVSLLVKDALEEGPVVCTVTLKNVSKARLKYATSMFEKAPIAVWTPTGSLGGNR